MIRKILRAEPARVGAALLSIATIIAGFTDLVDPAQAAVIIGAVVAVLEVVRSVVFAPDTVEQVAINVAAGRDAGLLDI